jgi:hypothetical protein
MAQDLSKLKILKIAPSVFSPPKFSSGIKTYTLTLKKHLRDRGIKVHILGASLDGGSNRGDILVRIPKKSDFLFSLYAIPAYMKIKGEYDLIHISDPFFTLPLLLFATKKPSVLTLHEV